MAGCLQNDKFESVLKPLHLGVSVPDMEASIQWYHEVLGFKLERNTYLPALHAQVAFLRCDDFSIELFKHDEFQPLPEKRRNPNEDIKTVGNKHVAFSVNNIEKLKIKFKEKNVDFATDIFNVNKNKVFFIRDNSGNLIEFIQQTFS
jgi:methylmalonyl-CoA/ethylmalonyl-CoA epimerase